MKKGFTLIEVLGVVVILSIIVVLAFPSIVENIRKTEDQLSNASKLLVKNATELYMDEKKTKYPQTKGDVYCITFDDLFKSGKLKSPFIDTKTGKEYVTEDKFVKVEVIDEIEVSIVTSCTEVKK